MSFVFANNVSTKLASAITSTATTITLSSSANLPTLSSGEQMPLTLLDAATKSIYEICYVTAISGSSLTVLRAQEGTTASAYNAGDYAFSGPTAGTVFPVDGQDINVVTLDVSGTATLGTADVTTLDVTGTIAVPNATSNNQPVALGQFPFSVGAGANQSTGYIKFPNGIILQWGFILTNGSSSGQTVTYPIAFPNAMFISEAGDQGSGMNTGALVNLSNSQGTAYGGTSAGTYAVTDLGWIAVGY